MKQRLKLNKKYIGGLLSISLGTELLTIERLNSDVIINLDSLIIGNFFVKYSSQIYQMKEF